jgi:hypothetical protein
MLRLFSFVRNYQTVFQSDWAILYFNQQRMKIPVAPAIEMPAFWILTI